MTYLLLTTYYLLFTYLSWKNTKWGVFLVVTLLPSYMIRFTIFGIPMTLLEGMIWLLFIVWFIKLKKEKNLTLNPLQWLKNLLTTNYSLQTNNPIPKPYRLPIILFIIASTISVFVSPNFSVAAGIWKAYFVEALMFFIIFIYTIKSSDDLKKVIRFLGLTVILIGIFAVLQKLTGVLIPNPFWADEATRRITTFFGYPNANALFVLPIIFLIIGNLISSFQSSIIDHRFQTKNYFLIIFDIIAITLGILTIIWTKSTGAFLALIVGLLSLLIFYKKTRLVTLLLILLILIGSILSPTLIDKLQNIIASTNEIRLSQNPSDLQIRVQMWRETFKMMNETPIFGSGLAGYQTLIEPYHKNQHLEIFLYPHNFFLNFWVETGLLGLISIIWILVVFFIIGLRSLIFDLKNHKPKTKNQILTITTLSSMIVLLVYGLVDVPYFKNDLSILFWLLIASSIILYNNSRRRAGVVERDSLENC